jgi:hypothetical protein
MIRRHSGPVLLRRAQPIPARAALDALEIHLMSRALNLDAPQEHVLDTCAKHQLAITQIETLVSGGTRVVLKTADAAAILARSYKKQIIDGPITRTPSRTIHA